MASHTAWQQHDGLTSDIFAKAWSLSTGAGAEKGMVEDMPRSFPAQGQPETTGAESTLHDGGDPEFPRHAAVDGEGDADPSHSGALGAAGPVGRPNLYKTRLCLDHVKGQCTYSRCKFAHGEAELRPVTVEAPARAGKSKKKARGAGNQVSMMSPIFVGMPGMPGVPGGPCFCAPPSVGMVWPWPGGWAGEEDSKDQPSGAGPPEQLDSFINKTAWKPNPHAPEFCASTAASTAVNSLVDPEAQERGQPAAAPAPEPASPGMVPLDWFLRDDFPEQDEPFQ